MRAVDRYITYYKGLDDEYVDILVFDKLKKAINLDRHVDENILGSLDSQERYFNEIELPGFIFELIVSSLNNCKPREKKSNHLEVFHLYSKVESKRIDLIIERKNKVYFMDFGKCINNHNYFDLSIFVNHEIMEVIIKQLDSLGYRDISKKISND